MLNFLKRTASSGSVVLSVKLICLLGSPAVAQDLAIVGAKIGSISAEAGSCVCSPVRRPDPRHICAGPLGAQFPAHREGDFLAQQVGHIAV